MSVILFDADELANVATYLCATHFRTDALVQGVAEMLAAYSIGNTWAFNRQYREEREPVSVADILKAMDPRRFDRAQARGTLRLLAYNGITNAGNEFSLQGYFEALAHLLNQALARALEDLETLEVRR